MNTMSSTVVFLLLLSAAISNVVVEAFSTTTTATWIKTRQLSPLSLAVTPSSCHDIYQRRRRNHPFPSTSTSRLSTLRLGESTSSSNSNSSNSSNNENLPTEKVTASSPSESEAPIQGKEDTVTTNDGKESEEATDKSISTTSSSSLPTYKELLLFTGTTALIWISEPLLSLVDTTVVGLTQRNAVVQVAALGPATTLIDSLQYLTYFLAMATTTEIAKYLALKDYRKLQQTTSQILGVAGLLGILISVILFVAGMPMLQTMIGGSQSPELAILAARYCWIRATVAPLAVMGMVAESSCLANVDTTTPAIAVMTASIVNVVGDLALSFLGIQGAAIATAIATATSTAIMLRKVKKRKAEWREKELQQQQLQQQLQSNGSSREDPSPKVNGNGRISSVVEGSPTLMKNASTDNENGDETKPVENIGSSETQQSVTEATTSPLKEQDEVPFLSLPGRKALVDLVKLSGPMFFVMLGKIACYGAMSIRATDFGVVNLAAHSIMMRVFFFFTCFGDSLSQATQSFLPQALYPKPSQTKIRKILKRFLIFSSCLGIVISSSSSWILTNLGSYLTNDKIVVGTIAKHSKFVVLSLLLHPFIMLTEGTLTATRDFKNLTTSYLVTMTMHFSLLLLACSAFRDIWRVLFLFQSIRLSLFASRVIQKVLKRNNTDDNDTRKASAAVYA